MKINFIDAVSALNSKEIVIFGSNHKYDNKIWTFKARDLVIEKVAGFHDENMDD